jgi:hypothetical protein
VQVECIGAPKLLRIYDYDTEGNRRQPAAFSKLLLPGPNTVPRRVLVQFLAQFPNDPDVAAGRLVLRTPVSLSVSAQDLKEAVDEAWSWQMSDQLAATVHNLLYFIAEAIRDEPHTSTVVDVRDYPELVKKVISSLTEMLESGERFNLQDPRFGEGGEEMLKFHARFDEDLMLLQQYGRACAQAVEHAKGSDGPARVEDADGFAPVERLVALVAELWRVRTGGLPDTIRDHEDTQELCARFLTLASGRQQINFEDALAKVLPWLRENPENRYRTALHAAVRG